MDGNESMSSITKHLNISFQTFKQWVKNYEAMGTDAFATTQNKHYSKVEKEQVVVAYLAGEDSLMDICKRFKILIIPYDSYHESQITIPTIRGNRTSNTLFSSTCKVADAQ